MKFSTSAIPKEKVLHIPALSNGMSNNLNTHSEKIFLKEAKNIIFQNGVLKTRPGLYTVEDGIIEKGNSMGERNFILSSTDITLEGIPRKIVTEIIERDDSLYVCTTYIINNEGWVKNCASMEFHRVSDDNFFIPANITYIKGKPSEGVGLFALVKLVNIEDFSKEEGRIFELSEDLNEWLHITGTYTPTVFINGRGNKYEISAASNQAFTGEPTYLEKLNLVNGYFNAYYSSDGHSSVFRLPFSDITDDAVFCRFYHSLENYTEWIIEKGKNSASANYNKGPVTLHIDRKKGIFYFTVEAGDFEVPLISHQNENNIKITACKRCDYNLIDIAGSQRAITVNSKIILANGNKVFASDTDNPLYFPADNVLTLGESDTLVTALIHRKNSVYAFKENEIYQINLKDRKLLNTISLLADNSSFFYTGSVLNGSCITKTVGCGKDGVVCCDDTALYWYNDPGIYYKMKFSSCEPEILFRNSDTNQWENKICALCLDGYTFFFSDSKALVFSKDSEDSPAYIWEFPANCRILCGGKFDEKCWLLLENTDNNMCFISSLQGEKDITATIKDREFVLEEHSIDSFIRTDKIHFGCDNSIKKINNISINLSGRALISVNGTCRKLLENLPFSKEPKTIKVIPGLPPVTSVELTLLAKEPVSVGSLHINYQLLKA